MSDWKAYTVIGTNVVIDCGTVEEAIAYMDRLAATPAPLMSKGEADARIDLMKMTKQRDDLLEALAVTPAPLDVERLAEAIASTEWDWRGSGSSEFMARVIAAALDEEPS